MYIGYDIFGDEVSEAVIKYTATEIGGTIKAICTYIEADDISRTKMGLVDVDEYDIEDIEEEG